MFSKLAIFRLLVTEKEFEDGTRELWETYATALETDYASGKSAKS